MNPSGDTMEDLVVGLGAAATREDLSVISQPECAAAIWRRPRKPGFTAWLDALHPDQLPRARVVLQPTRVRGAIEQICDISGTPASKERDELVDDVAKLADTFASIMGASYLRLRIDVVTTNACRRFHRDAVTARLICTYRGRGTQYGISRNGEDPARVFSVPTGSPMILRGSKWPERPATGLLHRSPPIEGTGETRSVLVLDPIRDHEELD